MGSANNFKLEIVWHSISKVRIEFKQTIIQASKFRIECTCPLGKWIVKITCPNVPFTCLKYIKPMQLMWKSEICSHPSDKSCRYSTCATVIFTHLRWSDEWNFEPCYLITKITHQISMPLCNCFSLFNNKNTIIWLVSHWFPTSTKTKKSKSGRFIATASLVNLLKSDPNCQFLEQRDLEIWWPWKTITRHLFHAPIAICVIW